MYNKASGKPLAGLTKRRAAEAARYARAMGVVSAGIR
jgi:GH24 family phage-related lysozyme (muramidase)